MTPRIAIFHNFMDNIGGAEIVGLTLARELDADFYTTNIDPHKIKKMGFADVRLISIGRIPINAPYRQQAALMRFRFLRLGKKYDLYIIDGDWAMSGAVNNKPNIWYVHSPIREIWDLYEYTRRNTVKKTFRLAFDAWVSCNRSLNLSYVRHVNTIVCNSENTAGRVRRYLGRDSSVIHPPVETADFRFGQTGDYWLAVNRLITHKRIEIQLDAFRQMPEEKLVIVGSYEKSSHFTDYVKHIRQIKPSNVEILHWVDRNRLIELYADCKGFLTTSRDEDFGMTAVEAMASGKPVIAPREGGYAESVIDGVTGKLIEDMDAGKLAEAVRQLSGKAGEYREAAIRQASVFDIKVFMEKIKRAISKTI